MPDQRSLYDSQSFDLFNVAQRQVEEAFREQGFDDIFKMPESMKDVDLPSPFARVSAPSASENATSGNQPQVPSGASPVASEGRTSAGANKSAASSRQAVASPSPTAARSTQQRVQTSAPHSSRPSDAPHTVRASRDARSANAQTGQRGAVQSPSKPKWNWLLYVGLVCTLLGLWFIGIPLLVLAIVRRVNIENELRNGAGAPFRGSFSGPGANPARPASSRVSTTAARRTGSAAVSSPVNQISVGKVVAVVIVIAAMIVACAAVFMVTADRSNARSGSVVANKYETLNGAFSSAGQRSELESARETAAATYKPRWCTDQSKIVRTQNEYLEVGSTIPAGVYVLEPAKSDYCYYEVVSRNASGDNKILFNGFSDAPTIIETKDGERLELDGFVAYPIENYVRDVDASALEPGAYRVGTDIPAGTYRFEAITRETTRGTVEVCATFHRTQDAQIDYRYFEGNETVILHKGECVVVEGARGTLVSS